jgi:hypothetical protein
LNEYIKNETQKSSLAKKSSVLFHKLNDYWIREFLRRHVHCTSYKDKKCKNPDGTAGA